MIKFFSRISRNFIRKIGKFGWVFLLLSGVSHVRAADLTIDDLNLAWSPPSLTLAWDEMVTAASAPTTTFNVLYRIYRYPGYTTSTTTIVTLGTLVAATDDTSLEYPLFYNSGVYSYVVKGFDILVATHTDTSPIRYTHFLHYTKDPLSADIFLEDAQSKQDGFGQIWNFDYKLRGDAYVSIGIYPPGTTFTTNVQGFINGASSSPVKMVLDVTPRAYQMNGDLFTNHDTWDLRNSSGTVVPKGVYFALFTVYDPLDGTTVMDTTLKTISNDNIKLTNISASAITDTASSSQIAFEINANALVNVIICSPGTKFTIATSTGTLSYGSGNTFTYDVGDNLPLNPNTLAVDGSRLLKLLSFNVVSGAQAFAWNGANEAGTALSSGLYRYAVSAHDTFGNHAVQATGDDYSQFGTIAINKAASQPSAVFPGIAFPAARQALSDSISNIYAVFHPAGQNVVIDGAQSSVVLRAPDGRSVPGHKIWSPEFNRLQLDLTGPLVEEGDYTAVYTVRGTVAAGIPFEVESVTNFVYTPPSSLKESYVAPNPVKGVDKATFYFPLDTDSAVRIQIFNILGEKVYERNENLPAGNQRLTWYLQNGDGRSVTAGIYVFKIRVQNAKGTQDVTKKFTVIR